MYCEDCKRAGAREGEAYAAQARTAGGGAPEEGQNGGVAGSDAVEVVDFLALAAFLVAAARAQALARQDRDHLLGRCAGRQLVANAIGHHRQARALPAQCLRDRPAAFVPVAIPFIADSLAITALFHPDSLTRLADRGRGRERVGTGLVGATRPSAPDRVPRGPRCCAGASQGDGVRHGPRLNLARARRVASAVIAGPRRRASLACFKPIHDASPYHVKNT
ncbi:hypothetical protein EMIT0158MI4_160069 [Burkholderia ambifaria]